MNNHSLANETLPVNEEDEFDNISLDQGEETFKYTIVPNDLIRDSTISPNCRWLITYLIGNKPGWTIKFHQLAEMNKKFFGRDSMRKILNEAITAGYIRRDIVMRPMKKGKGKLKGYKYTVASTPKFKKSLRCTDYQETEHQYPEHQYPDGQFTKEVLYKEVPSQEILSQRKGTSLKVPEEPLAAKAADKKIIKPKAEFSEEVQDFGNKLIQTIQKHEPEYFPPKNLAPILTAVDLMLRNDQREPSKLLDILNWALSDSFWKPKMLKPKTNPAKYLRDQYLQFKNQMLPKPAAKPRRFAPSSNDQRAFEIMEEMQKRAI